MGVNLLIQQQFLAVLLIASAPAGLLLLTIALLLDARARCVSNLIELTRDHRVLWERLHSHPELARILNPSVYLTIDPITGAEEMFVVFVILHLNSSYYAMSAGLFQKPKGLKKDIKMFFSLPIPRAVWEKVKVVQDPKFAKLVEESLTAFNEPNEGETEAINLEM